MEGDFDRSTKMIRVLMAVFVTCVGISSVAGCGGCDDGSMDIYNTCSLTVAKTRTVSSSSGWWLWKKVQYRKETYYTAGEPYCCTGFTKIGSQCFGDCGGCLSESPHRQRACTERQTVKQAVTSKQSYSCGGWWSSRTCYRQVVTYVSSVVQTYKCCSDFQLAGSSCDYSKEDTSSHSCKSKYADAGQRQSLIVGGLTARRNEFPWQVRVTQTNGGMCGGTVIAPGWVLTAAHCATSRPSSYTVIAGDHVRSIRETAEQTSRVSAVHVHPAYDARNAKNDIAILELASPLVLNDDVTAACLPKTTSADYVGKDVLISGWGRTVADDSTSGADTLQFARVKVVSKATCDNIFGNRPNVLCVSDGDHNTRKSACFGDSGGPMVLEENKDFTLIGIASFVAKNGCASGYEFVYTDVSGYISWIDTTT